MIETTVEEVLEILAENEEIEIIFFVKVIDYDFCVSMLQEIIDSEREGEEKAVIRYDLTDDRIRINYISRPMPVHDVG